MFNRTTADGAPTPNNRRAGLAMTAPVALQSLFVQLQSYETLVEAGMTIDINAHFDGPITPPDRSGYRPIGDPVFDAVAAYASVVVARSGLLTSRYELDESDRRGEHGRLTRELSATEHAVAIDLARPAPNSHLRERQASARKVLALAAYWCDRPLLVGLRHASAHPLLGLRPTDAKGIALYDHAVAAFAPSRKPTTGGRMGNGDIGPGIGIGITPAA